MVEWHSSKVHTGVRFSVPAQIFDRSRGSLWLGLDGILTNSISFCAVASILLL